MVSRIRLRENSLVWDHLNGYLGHMIDADRVRHHRQSRGWSRQQLATAAGLCTNTIHALERGDSPGSAASLARLAEALDVDPVELLATRRRAKSA